MDWSDLRVFLVACRSGSAGRAAAELGVSVSTVTRRLATLEKAGGRPLMERMPTGLRPTAAGRALFEHAERAERAILAGQAAASAYDEAVAGDVVVAVPTDMMMLALFPRLGPFVDAHPDLTLVFDHGGRVADLSRREADIAVRLAIPEQGPELIARRLRPVQLRLFTSDPHYVFQDEASLSSLRFVGQAGAIGKLVDRWSHGQYSIRVQDPVAARHAVAAGLGVALLPRTFGRLMPQLHEIPFDTNIQFQLQMITHRAIRERPAVRAVWDVLVELLLDGGASDLEMLRVHTQCYGW